MCTDYDVNVPKVGESAPLSSTAITTTAAAPSVSRCKGDAELLAKFGEEPPIIEPKPVMSKSSPVELPKSTIPSTTKEVSVCKSEVDLLGKFDNEPLTTAISVEADKKAKEIIQQVAVEMKRAQLATTELTSSSMLGKKSSEPGMICKGEAALLAKFDEIATVPKAEQIVQSKAESLSKKPEQISSPQVPVSICKGEADLLAKFDNLPETKTTTDPKVEDKAHSETKIIESVAPKSTPKPALYAPKGEAELLAKFDNLPEQPVAPPRTKKAEEKIKSSQPGLENVKVEIKAISKTVVPQSEQEKIVYAPKGEAELLAKFDKEPVKSAVCGLLAKTDKVPVVKKESVEKIGAAPSVCKGESDLLAKFDNVEVNSETSKCKGELELLSKFGNDEPKSQVSKPQQISQPSKSSESSAGGSWEDKLLSKFSDDFSSAPVKSSGNQSKDLGQSKQEVTVCKGEQELLAKFDRPNGNQGEIFIMSGFFHSFF